MQTVNKQANNKRTRLNRKSFVMKKWKPCLDDRENNFRSGFMRKTCQNRINCSLSRIDWLTSISKEERNIMSDVVVVVVVVSVAVVDNADMSLVKVKLFGSIGQWGVFLLSRKWKVHVNLSSPPRLRTEIHSGRYHVVKTFQKFDPQLFFLSSFL